MSKSPPQQPSPPPKKTILSIRQIDETVVTQPLPKRIRTDSSHLDTHIVHYQIPHQSPHLLTDTTASSGQPYQPPTPVTTATNPNHHPPPSLVRPSTATQPSLHKECRRIWNRRSLAQSGASQILLEAIDTFSENVPVIPTTLDPSRKMYIRNMRAWITILSAPDQHPLWNALIHILRTDPSLTTIGVHWDQDICRYILYKIVQDNQAKQQHHNQPKQSRQAVNNAIKRELTCPTESGNSSRGKTFRDLFREKCKAGGVTLPVIEQTTRTKRHPDTSSKTHPPDSTAPTSGHAIDTPPRVSISGGGGEESYVSLPLPHTAGKPPPPGVVDHTELSKLRAQCPETDEWNRTAWWRLTNDEDVKRLPLLLAHSNLYELHSLLTDFRWITRTFHCVDFSKGMRQVPTDGYDVMLKYAKRPGTDRSAVDIEGFRLIRNALMVILPILSKETPSSPSDPTFIAHLATQLVGRLLDLKRRFPNIACLIQSIEEYAPRPWLRPLTRCFHQPRTDIKLAVPSNGIYTPHLIVLSEDGTLLATSGSSIVEVPPESTVTRSTTSTQRSTTAKDSKGTLQKRKRSSIVIWDVQSGKCVCKGPDLPNLVRHLSLSRDNNCIIGENVDGLFFWHLDKSKDMWTISSQIEATPRIKSVWSITAAVGSIVLTTHRLEQEPMIVHWDTKTGQKLDSFNRVTSKPNCVDISADGKYFASGHDNGFIHLWTMKEQVPVLSFKNEGADRGPQQVVALPDVNRTRETQYKPISISFYEKGEEQWLTAVSSNRIIRVWLLPPRPISQDQWKSFVSSRRTAVLKCPGIQDVQWSQNGNFFTGGDDGIARMWKRLANGKWEWYAIDKDNRESRSTVSTVLLSCGKRSGLVATYVAKSPYVTVWDMSRMEGEMRSRKRRSLYRAYIPLMSTSTDARDIEHLTCLDGIGEVTCFDGGMGDRRSEEDGKDSKWMSRYEDNYGMIRNGMIRNELEKFFRYQNMKSSTTPDGEELQQWLRVVPGGRGSGMEGPEGEEKALRVCFEHPVITGQSGVFKTNAGRKDTSIGDMNVMSSGMEVEGSEGEQEVKRRGMVAALYDGTIGIFELEEAKEGSGEGGGGGGGGIEIKEEGKTKGEKGQVDGVEEESGSIVNEEEDGMLEE